jgi:CheY-like chemotaxis protein/CheY-specific phosphatase CheX
MELIDRTMNTFQEVATHHFQEEFDLKMSVGSRASGSVEALALRNLTATIHLSGPTSFSVAFSFDRSLAERLFEVQTAGISVTEEERHPFLLETVGETINVVLGHSTADLATLGCKIALSVPFVIEEEKGWQRPEEAQFTRVTLSTEHGNLDIDLISPRNPLDASASKGKSGNGLRVMIVDDSLLVARKLETILSTLGHETVCTAASGEEALSAYQCGLPDLVTMDITMGGMDGIQATRLIVESYPDAKVVMVTSHGQEAMVREALKAGARGYVLKPVRPDKLEAMIKKVMGV